MFVRLYVFVSENMLQKFFAFLLLFLHNELLKKQMYFKLNYVEEENKNQ